MSKPPMQIPSRCRAVGGLVVAFFAFFAVGAAASDADFVGLLALAVETDIAGDIQLTETTRSKLTELIDRRIDEAQELVLGMKDLPQDQRDAQMRAFVAESERQGMAFLSDQQRMKLNQIRIARTGMLTLAESGIAEQLKLTDDQKRQIADLIGRMKVDLTQGGETHRRITQAKYERRLSDILTRPQLTGWEMLAGIVDDGPLPENDAAADANIADDNDPKTGAAAGVSTPALPGASAATDGLLRFNFHKTPWEPVLEWFAEQAGYSLQMDDGPLGSFTLVDENEYTPSEALDQINSVLLTRGYTLVRNRKQLMLINKVDDGIPPAIVENITPDQLDERGKYEIVKCLFTLKRAAVKDLENSIEPLVDEDDGILSVMPASKQILVQETGGNLRIIRSIIEKAEEEALANSHDVKIHKLKHVAAEEVLAIVRPLLNIPDEDFKTEDGNLVVAIEPFGSRIFVAGTSEMIERFETIVNAVDVDPETGDAAAPDELQLKVYSHRADPQSVLDVVRVMLAGLEDVRAASDPATGNLIVLARTAQHDQVQELLDKMQRDAVQFDVVPMRKYGVESMILMLNTFYPAVTSEGEKEAQNKGPVFTADLNTNKLILRGTAAEIEAIKSLVDKIDPPFDPDSDYPRATVRHIPLDGLNANSILREAELLWPNMNRANRINVKSTTPVSGGLRIRGTDPNRGPLWNLDRAPDRSRRPANKEGQRSQQDDLDTPSGASPASTKSARYLRPSRVRLHLTAFQQEDCESNEEQPAPQPTTEQPQSPADPRAESSDKPEISITVTESGIYFRSDDLDALDDFELLLRDIVSQRGTTPAPPTIIYVKYVKATEAKSVLDQVLGLSSGNSAGGGLGGLASNLIGGVGGDLLGGLLGGGDDLGGSLETSGSVKIVAEPRLNALIVQANEQDLQLIEDMLVELDRSYAPQDPKAYGETFIIPVYYTTADEIANVVKQAFPEQIRSEASGQQRQQQATQQFVQQMLSGRGRGGGGGGGGGGQQDSAEEAKMSIGVDPRSNSLIVTGPEHLYVRVRELVDKLDRRGITDNEGISVVTLKGNVNPTLLSNALQSILGSKIQASTSSTDSASNSATQAPSTSGDSRAAPATRPNVGEDGSQFRQQIEMLRGLQNLRGQGDASGRGGPGGFPTRREGGEFPAGERGRGGRGG